MTSPAHVVGTALEQHGFGRRRGKTWRRRAGEVEQIVHLDRRFDDFTMDVGLWLPELAAAEPAVDHHGHIRMGLDRLVDRRDLLPIPPRLTAGDGEMLAGVLAGEVIPWLDGATTVADLARLYTSGAFRHAMVHHAARALLEARGGRREGPFPWVGPGWTRADIGALAAGLRGQRLQRVAYRFPEMTGDPVPYQREGVDQVDMSVDLLTERGERFRAAWTMIGRDQGLLLGPLDVVEIRGAPTTAADASTSPRWATALRREIEDVRLVWRRLEMPEEAVVAVELRFQGGGSVTFALGEIGPDGSTLSYMPDAILVFFDPALARAYEREIGEAR
jgi:hypothetical protein